MLSVSDEELIGIKILRIGEGGFAELIPGALGN